MKRIFATIVALAMMLVGCTAFASTDITDGVIRVDGVGALQNKNAVAGYRAAKVDAMRNALEEVQGVHIDSETTVQDSITASDVIKTRINGMLKGAKVVEQFKDADGYHVIIEFPVHGAQSLAAAVMPATTAPPAALPSASVFVPQIPASTGPYTGLIVDCTGLGLETAMAPAVFTADNKLVYGKVNFSYEQVINQGYVGYARSLSNGVSRAGSNPLIVRAQGIKDFVNPIVSSADAGKILAENQQTGFLNAGNVVFVK
ncbi:MAG: LPP20 family lipoprotein [Anaerovibrio sp.]|uniref:LPP20 family lipoprotein n=1 Tax=Anaerovibrio sp. TaxID=1872532 RepID=UPI0025E82D65|nr:LPP20 family lipoprotein [Anaerovibrio sp.]MCR5175803.1 LPP20 family lipoprotein [Anaerovibrio sp.]